MGYRACLILMTPAVAWAEGTLGGGVGLSILSGDAAAVAAPAAAASLYDPGNGAIGHVFAGWRVREYAAVEGAYSWTRNRVAFRTVAGGAFRERVEQVSQHHAGADFLLYFRGRRSWVQPFLSVGVGVSRFGAGFGSEPGLRVAAGVDVVGRNGVGFRYAFLETITPNPLGRSLSPQGQRSLMTFQNLFGVVWRWGR